MIYYTGDIHGSTLEIVTFCMRFKPTKDDTIVILGDVGANYFGDFRDNKLKEAFAKLEPTIFCIHGNHEMRPWNIPTYKTKEWNGGTVWYEEKYPNILFAKDGEIFNIEDTKHLVIGGAYSVDKFYRLSRGYGWWEDEQPSEEIKQYVEKQIKEKDFDVILSHTCPFKYEPIETFLPGIDQSTVDTSTEEWLDKIEESVDYKAWYCGHWHIILELTDVGRMLFMKRFLKDPPESEMEKILSAHSSYAHGYMVEEVKNILENRGGIELVSTDRKANRIKLKDDESCIPDVITKDHWGYTFYEVECGTHNYDDFYKKCNKLIQVTRTLMFIGPGRNVVEKKLLPKITGWVKNVKPEFLRANNISIKVASMHDFKQGKWTYSYDMKRGLPVCNIKNSKKKENANG